jgi:hypothetical protein
MAKLKASDGFEIEFLLHRGIQVYFHTVTIRFWKDGKGWLIPEEKSEHCDPIELITKTTDLYHPKIMRMMIFYRLLRVFIKK